MSTTRIHVITPGQEVLFGRTPLLPENIQLVAGGEGWMGTFGLMVKALANDLLSDKDDAGGPAPFSAELLVQNDDGTQALVAGDVSSVEELTKLGPCLMFSDSTPIPINSILSVTV